MSSGCAVIVGLLVMILPLWRLWKSKRIEQREPIASESVVDMADGLDLDELPPIPAGPTDEKTKIGSA
jgi:hypothetical protein